MKQNLRRVELLEEVGGKAKGVQVTLSAPIAAKLIKDGKAEIVTTEKKEIEVPKPKKKTKRK
jgi:hypothetical protein